MDDRLTDIRFQPQFILDAGSGTDHGSQLLQQRYPEARICQLDISIQMLKQYSRHPAPTVNNHGRQPIWQVNADLNRIPFPANVFDMVWSNQTLSWLRPPEQALTESLRILKPGGLFMFSTLGLDTFKELKYFANQHEHHHLIPAFTDMHDNGDQLLAYGFSEPVMDMEEIMPTYIDAPSVIQDIKTTGSCPIFSKWAHSESKQH